MTMSEDHHVGRFLRTYVRMRQQTFEQTAR